MLSMLVFWNAAGEVVGTLGWLVQHDAEGAPIGIVDFEATELSGARIRDVCEVSNAVGGGTWPEWLGVQAHQFRVQLAAHPAPARARVVALVHKQSGHRRERAGVEATIAERIAVAVGKPADIRDVVGGPGKPLLLDENGRTKPKVPSIRPDLPLIGVKESGK